MNGRTNSRQSSKGAPPTFRLNLNERIEIPEGTSELVGKSKSRI
jgi:hypothetical protein